jgi:tetratricopeptide (TPR) repeat protein
MSHLGQEALRRILGGEGGPREAENAAEHLVSCDRCRALAATLVDDLRAEDPGLRGKGPLQLVFDLIDRERRWDEESLAAIAEWAEVRHMPSRRSQRDRVRMKKSCHTIAFFKLLLSELKEASSWDEAEFLAGLALLSAEGMRQRQQITQASNHDLQAEVWTAVANARRRAAEWKPAHQALANAEKHRKEGTGEPHLEAGLLSITASTLADEGHVSQALDALERCREIYEDLSEWTLLARTLVKMANVLEPMEPAKALVALDRATPLIPAEDSYLRLLAELLRAECLIGICKPSEALQVFRRCSPMLIANPRVRIQIRGRFISAKLLDALGFKQQAERLFDEVVDRDLEHELYKDAFLDLLYLYGRHMQAGDLEKAARVCRRALTDSSLSAVAHEQLRTLWIQLLEAAQRQAISQDLLRDLRQYLNVHWKHPAATPPAVGFPGAPKPNR